MATIRALGIATPNLFFGFALDGRSLPAYEKV
jgi:hypothetical protein